jgi:hypothetical protein
MLVFVQGFSQDQRTYGLRLGFDISRIPLYLMDPAIYGFEFSADYEAAENLYPVIEFGFNSLSLERENYDYYSNGNYFRLGADYNILKLDARDQYEMAFIGVRYAYSSFTYNADDIHITESYWGDYSGLVPETLIKAHWIEFTLGLRAEIFKNIFMGWSFRGRIMLSSNKSSNIDPYNIPGYGKGKNNTSAGFNYSVYYKIPMLKK